MTPQLRWAALWQALWQAGWHGDEQEEEEGEGALVLTLTLSSYNSDTSPRPNMPRTHSIFSNSPSEVTTFMLMLVVAWAHGVGLADVRDEVGEKIQLDCPGEGRGGCTWRQRGLGGIGCCFGDNCQVE